MTTRAARERGPRSATDAATGGQNDPVRTWALAWGPAPGIKRAKRMLALRWAPTGERADATECTHPRFPNLEPVHDPTIVKPTRVVIGAADGGGGEGGGGGGAAAGGSGGGRGGDTTAGPTPGGSGTPVPEGAEEEK